MQFAKAISDDALTEYVGISDNNCCGVMASITSSGSRQEQYQALVRYSFILAVNNINLSIYIVNSSLYEELGPKTVPINSRIDSATGQL